MILHFTVFGAAVPKGSMRAFLPKGGRRPIVTANNATAIKSWQQLVAEAASRARSETGARQLFDGPVRLTVAFHLPRPKAYQKRGDQRAHLTAPDLDKLVRAVGDALKDVAWMDDAQIVDLVALKRYAPVGEAPFCEVTIEDAVGAFAVPRGDLPLFPQLAKE